MMVTASIRATPRISPRRLGARIASGIGVVIALIYVAFPFYWLLKSSLTPADELFNGELVPTSVTGENYVTLFAQSPVFTWLGNSILVAVIVTVVTVTVAVLGAYGLVFFDNPVSRSAGSLILLTYMFPGVVIVIPSYAILTAAGLSDSIGGLVIIELVLTVPFGIWMLRGFMAEIPMELDEAARMDGASRLRVLWSVILPVARPGVIAIAVFAFIFSWNEYLFPLVLINTDAQKTLPLGVAGFLGNLTVQWGPLLASGVVTVIPVLVLFFFLQRYLVEGLMSGAVKG